MKGAKGNKTYNSPFSEQRKVNCLKRPIMAAEINIAERKGKMADDDRLSYELHLCLKEQLSQHLLKAFFNYFSTENLLPMNKNLNNIDLKNRENACCG